MQKHHIGMKVLSQRGSHLFRHLSYKIRSFFMSDFKLFSEC